MKHAIANLLRQRSAWQLVAIAAITASVGVAIPYNVHASTLRMMKPVLVLVFGIGGAALVLAFVRRAEEARGGRGWGAFVAGVVAVAFVIAFTTFSFGHHRRHMVAGCNASLLPETLPARQAALARAEAALGSPFAWLPRLVDDEAARECARSRKDLARVEQGLCTEWPLVDRECGCGDERYPYARCKEARCLYEPGEPERFDCPGDPIPSR